MRVVRASRAGLLSVLAAAVLFAAGCGASNNAESNGTVAVSSSDATKTTAFGADGRPLVGATAATGSAEAEGDGAVAVPANQASIQKAARLVQCLTRAGRQATYESATAYEMPTTEMTAALRAGTGGTVVEVEPSVNSDGDQGPTIQVFILGDQAQARSFNELLNQTENTALFAEETGQKDFETGYRETTDPHIKRAGDTVVAASDFLTGDEEELFTRTCGLGELSDE